MRIRLIVAPVAVLMCLVPTAALAQGRVTATRQYYVALGDSLARGAQPNASGTTVPTNKGYANDIYAAQKKKLAGLRLKELGCLGETTTTMMKGGICKYPAGSQLKAAVQFLHMHKGHIAFVTIDIGANDVDGCATKTGIDLTCVVNGEKSIKTNVPKIAAALRKAAGTKVPIVGMTYYDPFLADWLSGTSGQTLAAASQGLAQGVNKEISSAYSSNGVKIADVATAFHTYESLSKTETFHNQQVPVAVVEVCKLTWMCAAPPVGPNIHANTAGYGVIARVFEAKRL